MASLYGVNYTKSEINIPKDKIGKSAVNGDVQVAYDEITLAADLANADTISMCKIPAGARIESISIVSPTLGATGSVDIGNTTSATAYVANVALNGGATNLNTPILAKNVDGNGDEIEETLVLTCNAASNAGTGATIKVAVYFTVA